LDFISQAISPKEFERLSSVSKIFAEYVARDLLAQRAHVIGFTTTFYQKIAAIAVAMELRRQNCEAIIVFGGAACEMPMGQAIAKEFHCIDVVFHGESDESFPDFLDQVAGTLARTAPRGATYRSEHGVVTTPITSAVDLSLLECPDFSDYIQVLDEYPSDQKCFLNYETSRGCWWGQKHHCTFCGLNGNHMAYRQKDMRVVGEHLLEIERNNKIKSIQFTDNIIDTREFKNFFSDITIKTTQDYFAEVKSNLNESDICFLAESRILNIQPGIERINTAALKLMNKGVSAIQNIHCLRLCIEYGIFPYWNVIYGFPGEAVCDLDEELAVLRKISHLPPPRGCSKIRMDRYSPNFEKAKQLGFFIRGPSIAENFLFYGSSEKLSLCYHFEFDYLVPPTLETEKKFTELRELCESWLDNYSCGTFFQRYSGKGVSIFDYRNEDNPIVYELTGRPAEIYISCANRVVLSTLSLTAEDKRIITWMEEKSLIIIEGNFALALAVRKFGETPWPNRKFDAENEIRKIALVLK
jgi:ribosomal peptide maturation radical SAM protein 1